MADRKISEMSALAAGEQATDDLITVVDIDQVAAADKNKKMTMEALFQGIPGNVGIGTASPSFTLQTQITGTVDTDRFSTNNRIAYFNTSLAAGNQFGHIALKGFHGSGITFLRGSTGSETSSAGIFTDATDNLSFTTGGATERLRIDSSGRLGLGTSSAQRRCHIVSSADGYPLRLESTAQPAAVIEYIGNTTTTAPYAGALGNDFYLATNNQTRLYVASAGNVGIGTTSPDVELEILSTSLNSIAKLKSTQSTNGGYLQVNGTDFIVRNRDNGYLSLWTNDSEKLRIDSSGNVGIGTASPSTSFHVNGSGDQYITVTSSNSQKTGIQFGNASDPDAGGIRYASDDSFRIRTNNAERIRIDSSGNVGIGTSTPGAKLQIGSVTAATGTNNVTAFEIQRSDSESPLITMGPHESAQTTANPGASICSNNRGLIISNLETDLSFGEGLFLDNLTLSLRLYANNSERLRIDSSGNVGIGTTSVDLSQFGSNTGGVAIEDIGVTNTGLKIADGSNDNYLVAAGNGNFYQSHRGSGNMIFGVGDGTGLERMRITSSGNVGIGTASPDNVLHVYAAGTIARLESSTSTTALRFENTSANDGYIKYEAQDLTFYSANAERARIDSSGRLLVGTSTASTVTHNSSAGTFDVQPTLQVNGSGATTVFISSSRAASDDSGPQLAFARQGSTDGSIIPGGVNTVLGAIKFFGGDGNDLRSAGGRISCEVDGTPGANDMPGRLVFSTTADGASSPTERMRITNAGYMLIGNISSLPSASVFGLGLLRDGTGGAIYSSRNNTGSTDHVEFFNPNGKVGSISTNGSATAYNTSSDYRLKENVIPLTGAIDRLKLIPVHRFNFIANPDKTVDGFLAHEAQAVVPECVTGTKDEVDADGKPVYQGIDQSKLVPLLTAALQEALAEIESLKARVTALEP